MMKFYFSGTPYIYLNVSFDKGFKRPSLVLKQQKWLAGTWQTDRHGRYLAEKKEKQTVFNNNSCLPFHLLFILILTYAADVNYFNLENKLWQTYLHFGY